MKTPQELANMIVAFRAARGISRDAFSMQSDIPLETLKYIERDYRGIYPSIKTLVKLADAMEISLDELVRKKGAGAGRCSDE